MFKRGQKKGKWDEDILQEDINFQARITRIARFLVLWLRKTTVKSV